MEFKVKTGFHNDELSPERRLNVWHIQLYLYIKFIRTVKQIILKNISISVKILFKTE